MITTDKNIQTVDGISTINQTYYGLSTDSKPTTGVGNGSCFIEMDSGKVCFFDAASGLWIQFGS